MVIVSLIHSGSVFTLIGLWLGLAPVRVAHAQEPIAVIVHPGNPLSSISLDELRRLYLGTRTTLPNKEAVILLESPAVRERFYAAALRMSADRVKRHWMGIVFAGESDAPPKEVGGADALVQFVATHAGGIAFLPAGSSTDAVKVLAIEGMRPHDPGYPLR